MKRLLIASILLVGACASAQDTKMVACPPQGCAALDPPDPVTAAFHQAMLAHAEFDLQCPCEQLEIVNGRYVRGCGRMARYLWIHSRSNLAFGKAILDSPVIVAQ